MARKFFVVLELRDDKWDGDKHDMATWIDSAMNSFDANPGDIESTVYDNLEDFVHDHVLDVLASLGDEQVD